MEINKEIQDKIDFILENFDFQKCHEMMTLTDWSWWGKGIPTVAMLREAAIERIKCAIEQVYANRPTNEDIHIPNYKGHEVSYYSSSGGLKATVYSKGKQILAIMLEFVFTDWCGGCE